MPSSFFSSYIDLLDILQASYQRRRQQTRDHTKPFGSGEQNGFTQ